MVSSKNKNTKDKIIEAAYNCFSEKGYIATSTKEIAKEAGLSEITLFRHFGTKEAIFDQVIRKYSILSDLKQLNINIDNYSLEDILFFVGKRMYLTLLKKKKLIRILFSEINKYPGRLSDVYENLIKDIDELFINILLKKKQDHPLRDIDIAISVKGFIGMVFSYFQTNEIFLNKTISDDELDRVIRCFVSIFLKGISS